MQYARDFWLAEKTLVFFCRMFFSPRSIHPRRPGSEFKGRWDVKNPGEKTDRATWLALKRWAFSRDFVLINGVQDPLRFDYTHDSLWKLATFDVTYWAFEPTNHVYGTQLRHRTGANGITALFPTHAAKLCVDVRVV